MDDEAQQAYETWMREPGIGPAYAGDTAVKDGFIDGHAAGSRLVREILEAICLRDGLSLESDVEPGGPARNYELAMRLGIGHVFGLEGV